MRIRERLKLRKLGSRYMIVDTASGTVDMTDVYTLNGTAAFVWQKAAEAGDFELEDAVAWIVSEYEVETEVARKDLEILFAGWKENNLLK